jgi:hypothetical protein
MTQRVCSPECWVSAPYDRIAGISEKADRSSAPHYSSRAPCPGSRLWLLCRGRRHAAALRGICPHCDIWRVPGDQTAPPADRGRRVGHPSTLAPEVARHLVRGGFGGRTGTGDPRRPAHPDQRQDRSSARFLGRRVGPGRLDRWSGSARATAIAHGTTTGDGCSQRYRDRGRRCAARKGPVRRMAPDGCATSPTVAAAT